MAQVKDKGPCPECGADWRDKPIPEEYRLSGCYGPPDTAPTHYSRLIGVEYAYDHPHHYDGVSEWMCPDCGARWSRWTEELLKDGESAGRFR